MNTNIRLAAIYNVWSDSVELLRGSLMCIKDHVDQVIIVYQTVSNFKEPGDPLPDIMNAIKVISFDKVILHNYIPDFTLGEGAVHEKLKRNIGLDIARNNYCTHFLHMDSDEYYQDFGAAKLQYLKSGCSGSAAQMWTYFKSPTLRFENHEGYYVPFIHVLRPDTVAGKTSYPLYVDPTRRINDTNVTIIDEKMHHFSWVRKDINIKLRNSTAKDNIAKGTGIEDYNNPDLGAGSYVKDFQMKLVEVENLFFEIDV